VRPEYRALAFATAYWTEKIRPRLSIVNRLTLREPCVRALADGWLAGCATREATSMVLSVEVPGIAGEGAARIELDTSTQAVWVTVFAHDGEALAIMVGVGGYRTIANALGNWPVLVTNHGVEEWIP
jgi:hypothetical protein